MSRIIKMHIVRSLFIISCTLLIGCASTPKKAVEAAPVAAFDADSAYAFVAGQVAYGPRVPGTDAHQQCLLYIGSTLERLGAEVQIQTGEMIRYDGQMQHVANICAHLPADSAYADRPAILLTAHYDSRPWADQEEDYTQRTIPIPGANDGASGVGVLMEVARQWQNQPEHKRPIDIVLFDCEDMGTPAFYTGKQREHTWCLGAQLWAQTYNHAFPNQAAGKKAKYEYGILLDMVGDPNAMFPREYYSMQYAGKYVDKIWRTAEKLGFAHRFVNTRTYPITDDHYYVNAIAHIPCVDLIHYMPGSETGFAWWWHTQKDDMSNVNPNTLREVGMIVMTLINE